MGSFVSDLFHGKLFKGDKAVWMIYFFLCMISIMEVYSASSRLTFEGSDHWKPMVNQAIFLGGGFGLILLLHNMNSKWYMLVALPLFVIATGFLAFTALGGAGGSINGTNRWANFMGISFQPSELAKLALIMSAALVLAKTQAERVKTVRGKQRTIVGATRGKRYLAFALVGGATLLVCGLILLDNVSTALMLFLVVLLMMLIAHVPFDLMAKGMLTLTVCGALYAAALIPMSEATRAQMPFGKRVGTVLARISRSYDNDEKSVESDKSTVDFKKLLNDKNSQVTYAKIAIANSNFVGLGPGNSIQRDFLQHAESDFIFAIIIEELGVMGGLFVALLYVLLFIRVVKIAGKCPSFFSAYLVLGIGMMMTLQAFVNMSVAVDLIPVTGQTLPLISKGGTSILIISVYFAIIIGTSRDAEEYQKKKKAQMVTSDGKTMDVEAQ